MQIIAFKPHIKFAFTFFFNGCCEIALCIVNYINDYTLMGYNFLSSHIHFTTLLRQIVSNYSLQVLLFFFK